jgi:hypothetical protein
VKLTAYTIEGANDVWAAWEGVEGWMLDGPKLIMRIRRNGRAELATVELPQHVIGLADDSPPESPAGSRSNQYRPTPEKAHRPATLAERERHLHIPDKPPPRGRFGDPPRRRDYRQEI